MEDSDEKAIAIADEVMDAMGGRRAWDTTRYFQWTFFGRRNHTWDKIGQRSRIEIPGDSTVMILNLNDQSGKVFIGGEELSIPDSTTKLLEGAYRMWINDSYWLVMPFKLKDSGVTLKYAGQDTTTAGAPADVLELTFADVGVTPDNKYLVYVDKDSRLVTQWDFFGSYSDSLPRFQSPWPDYQTYGDLLLSGGAIGGNRLTNISVSQEVDEALFE